MASQQGTVRSRFPLASLPPPAAPPSNRVLPPRPSFNIRPPTFDQTFRLPIAQPPPPPTTAAPPPPSKPKPSSAPNSPPLPNSQVITPKLISPTPVAPPSPFQAPLAVSTTAPTTITAPAPTTTPTVPLSISQTNTLPKSPKTSPISHPPSPPRENKKVSDSKSLGGVKKKIITLAGDNKEAIMELAPSRKKSISISDELEGNYPVVAVLVNSNVQGVNNSILHNSYLSYHNPGVHLISHHVYTNPNSGTNE